MISANKLLAIDYLISSSSDSSSDISDNEDDILYLIKCKENKLLKPKIIGYVDIVASYSEKEVNIW